MNFARSRPHTWGRRQRWRWMPFIPASMGRRDGPPREPPATPGAARATAATGSARGSRVGLFSGGGCESLLPVLPGGCSYSECWRVERERGKQQPGGSPQPRHGGSQSPPTAQGREAERRCNVLLVAPQEVRDAAADTEQPGTGHQDHRQEGCRGDGRQPRREHRHLQQPDPWRDRFPC